LKELNDQLSGVEKSKDRELKLAKRDMKLKIREILTQA
jgi:hypothetical protein